MAAMGLVIVGCAANVNAPGGGGGAPPTGQNRPPVINALTANPTSITVTSGQPLTMQAVASDPDGETIAYNWTATGGTLNTTTGQLVYWVPPVTPGTYAVSVVVTDGRGASTSGSVNIMVNASGTAVVSPHTGSPAPSPTPTPAPVTQYTLNPRTNVFTWDWTRSAVDVRGWGTTVVTVQQLNAPYQSVICEYEGVLSRQIAVIRTGQPLELNFRGTAWVYVVGPSAVSGTVTFNSQGRSQTVPLTQAVPLTGGLAVSAPPGTNLEVRGGTALNDTDDGIPFFHMLAVSVSANAIRHQVLRQGDQVMRPEAGGTVTVGFTDTVDGLGDNSGSWTIEAIPD